MEGGTNPGPGPGSMGLYVALSPGTPGHGVPSHNPAPGSSSRSRLSSQRSLPRVSGETVSYLGDGVSVAAMGDLSGARAVGGDGSDNLGGVGHVAPGVGASGSGKDGGSRELHFG